MSEDLAKKGREVRTQLWGSEMLALADSANADFDPGFAKHLNEQLFGGVWGRLGLPIKTRSMLTVAVLLATGKAHEVQLHMRGALNLGITPEELKEIIVHVGQYCGVPTAVEGVRAFRAVTTQPQPQAKQE
jgi:4-carboxymuconolactone decarboxylase